MKSFKITRLALLASVASVALLQPAFALDAQAFVDRIQAVWGPLGYELTLNDPQLDGDTITVENATIGVKGVEGATEPTSFTTSLTFSGVKETGDGGYTADSVSLPDVEADFEGDDKTKGHVSLSDIELTGFYLPGGDTVTPVQLLQLVGAISTGPLSVTRNGEEVIGIESMESGSTFEPAQGSADLTNLSSTLSITGITADLSTVKEEDAQAGAVVEGLGLTNIAGDITGSFNWSMADGHMTVDQFLFDFADVGAIDMTVDLTGLTPALLTKLQEANKAVEAAGDPTSEAAQAAQAMMGMELLQGLSIGGANIRYDDASLAGKLLEFFAQAQGIDKAQMVEGLKAMVPQMIASVGIPELVDLVAPPVSTFLDDPKSLEVDVAPGSPTSLLVLMAAASNPASLITALGVTVTANEEENND
ncbi:MAG: hypothetical protein JWR51_187 [Devosia sp.]|uniref:hypothetical protein n=1 Tax=Devosia sp. TaxID=1871048 RepID=UPI00261013AF|nr:hypothetical protein [Devosia sp.]MDB5527084.1 hypothetical protein [Devosia sp.]